MVPSRNDVISKVTVNVSMVQSSPRPQEYEINFEDSYTDVLPIIQLNDSILKRATVFLCMLKYYYSICDPICENPKPSVQSITKT